MGKALEFIGELVGEVLLFLICYALVILCAVA